MEEKKFNIRKLGKDFRAPGENRTHDPQSSSSNAVITEILETLGQAGSKFNYNYTSHDISAFHRVRSTEKGGNWASLREFLDR